MGKLTDYAEAQRFDANDILIKDGTAGTKKIKASSAAIDFEGMVSVINRRNTWRGKALGATVSAEHKAAIAAGTFDDLFIGDYWEAGGFKWRIADMDYFYHCGDTDFTKHHLVIVPDTCLLTGADVKMHDTNDTKGGYTQSKMYTDTIPNTIKPKITAVFSTMLLEHKEYLVNAATDGHPSGGAWVNSTVELMNEIMVYGCPIFTPANNGVTVPTLYTTGNSQLALFRLNPGMIKTRQNYWLRDVVSASTFARVDTGGLATSNGASSTNYGVRPYFCIG